MKCLKYMKTIWKKDGKDIMANVMFRIKDSTHITFLRFKEIMLDLLK